MERIIGEVFHGNYTNIKAKVVEVEKGVFGEECSLCVFSDTCKESDNDKGECQGEFRNDGKDVYFIEVDE